MNISTRFAAVASTLVVVSALSIGAILLGANEEILVSRAKTELAFDTSQAGMDLRDSAANARAMVTFLADMPQVLELAGGGLDPTRTERLKRELSGIFVSLARSTADLLQVRLIGIADNGRELVRVNRTANVVRAVDAADLQQKGGTDYVSQTLDAAPGSILLFGVNLNREQGLIEFPYVPVLRVTTPVYSDTGRIFGLIVININMNKVLERMRSRFPTSVNFYLVNAQGEYVMHPDPNKSFGFEFGHAYRMIDEFPEFADFLSGDKAETSLVLRLGNRGPQIVHIARETLDATQQKQLYIAAALMPESAALVAGFDRQIQIGLLTLVLAGVGALVAILTSRWLVRPLRTLSRAARKLAVGKDIDHLDIAVDRKDEVGDLARGFTIMAQKLTDRQARLEEKEERIRAILDAAGTPIITIDRAGAIQGTNAATSALFGYRRDELMGANISILMNPDDAARHDAYLSAYRRTGKGTIINTGREVEARCKDGTPVPVHLSVAPVRLKDRLLYTGVMTDLREQKKINKLKDEFVSTVSHELRTPLTSIKGSLDLVKASMFGEIPPQMLQMIDIAHSNAERLSRLINDILDIEKIEAGKLSFHVESFDLGTFLRQTVDASSGHARALDVKLTLTECPDGLRIDADPDRLAQVVNNLVSNAVKVTPAKGEVRVSARFHKQRARIEIADQGPGVPADFRDKIFTRFAQANSTNTRATGGTGLGLAISKAIVEAHDGTIGYESGPDAGTVFHIEVPQHLPRASQRDIETERTTIADVA